MTAELDVESSKEDNTASSRMICHQTCSASTHHSEESNSAMITTFIHIN